MTTLLPKDADNNVIPALRLKDNAAHNIAATSVAARNINPFDVETKVISLYATAPVYIKFGDNTVSATNNDHYFPAGLYYDVALSGGSGKGSEHNYLSVLQVSETGTVYISEKE